MKAGELGIGVIRNEDRYSLLLTGEFDLASAPAIEQVLPELFANGASEVVFDLSQLEFIDSTGLRTLLFAKTLCEQHQCDFWLIRGTRTVQRVFELTGLAEKLPFREPAEHPLPAPQ
jgi:anti-sigma B factor antagonist